MFRRLVTAATLLLTTQTTWAIQIPKGLSDADREEIVQTIGLGTAPKMLTNPYPLGGYSGFEIGYSVEFINVRDINRLGCQVGSAGCANKSISDDNEFKFSRISIGKGLYHDIDVFFSFAPPIAGSNIFDYGGAVRWAFYQAEFLPITFSAIAHANRMNVQDDFINQNIGLELMLGINVDNFSLYFGGGQIWAKGTFLVQTNKTDPSDGTGNGTVSPNDPAANAEGTVNEYASGMHTVVGFSMQYQNLFSAAEIDHYTDSVYSIKVGTRF